MLSPDQNKVALFVCNDLVGLLFLNAAVPRMIELGFEPVIFNTGDHKNRKFKIPSPEDVSFYNVELLRDTIIPFAENANPQNAPNLTFRQLALKHGLEHHRITDVNDPEFIASIIDDERIVGGVAARFLQVFDQETISVFNEKGFLWNIHSGLLPAYGGLLTPPRAIVNGETVYGMTAHEMVPQIDKGAIIGKAPLPLDPNKPVLELYMDTVASGVDMFIGALAEYKANGYVRATPQPRTDYPCYTNPTQEEKDRFARHKIIYADPMRTVSALTSLFTEVGSPESHEFERRAFEAIAQHERSKIPAIIFSQPRKRKLGEPIRQHG